MKNTTHNTLHKRYQYNTNKKYSPTKQSNNNKTDKNKTIVIINENTLNQKVDDFIKENHIICLNKDPIDTYQKQIQHAIKKCNTAIYRHTQRYLINIKPAAPTLNLYIKTHKENEPMRPVVNNIHAPAYKIAKHLNKKLNNLINLPCTYTTKNAHEVAEELKTIHFDEHMKIISFDIIALYVNLPIQDILHTTKFWLTGISTPTQQ